MDYVLKTLIKTAGSAQEIDLEGDKISIGRDPSNRVCIDQGSVSSRHAQILMEGEVAPSIEDCDSSNGTFLNGDRLVPYQPAKFKAGDVIKVSDVEFLVCERERTTDIQVVPLRERRKNKTTTGKVEAAPKDETDSVAIVPPSKKDHGRGQITTP